LATQARRQPPRASCKSQHHDPKRGRNTAATLQAHRAFSSARSSNCATPKPTRAGTIVSPPAAIWLNSTGCNWRSASSFGSHPAERTGLAPCGIKSIGLSISQADTRWNMTGSAWPECVRIIPALFVSIVHSRLPVAGKLSADQGFPPLSRDQLTPVLPTR